MFPIPFVDTAHPKSQGLASYDIATLDEFWLYDVTDYEFMWFATGGKVPDRERVTIRSKKGRSLLDGIRLSS
jgi:hypothetical protein